MLVNRYSFLLKREEFESFKKKSLKRKIHQSKTPATEMSFCVIKGDADHLLVLLALQRAIFNHSV